MELFPGTHHNVGGLHRFPHWTARFLRAGTLCYSCVTWTHHNPHRKTEEGSRSQVHLAQELSYLSLHPTVLSFGPTLGQCVPGGAILTWPRLIH